MGSPLSNRRSQVRRARIALLFSTNQRSRKEPLRAMRNGSHKDLRDSLGDGSLTNR
jgi:hypothetical protein